MIFAIADQNISVRRNSDTLQTFKFSVTGSPITERSQKTTLRRKDLNPVVTRIRDANISLIIHSNTPEMELSVKSLSNKKVTQLYYLGNLNWPSAEPSVPKAVMTLPFTSKICIRWLLQSETTTLLVLDTAM